MVSLSSKAEFKRAAEICPLCHEVDIKSSRQYQSHVGHHLEQLALFVLPPQGDDEDNDVSDDETEDEADDSSQDGSVQEADRQQQQQPAEEHHEPQVIGAPIALDNPSSSENPFNLKAENEHSSVNEDPDQILKAPQREDNASESEDVSSLDGAASPTGSHDQKQSSTKSLLSKALQNANTAVQLDNAQDLDGARLAYHETCNALLQALEGTSEDDDRKKLEAIVSFWPQE